MDESRDISSLSNSSSGSHKHGGDNVEAERGIRPLNTISVSSGLFISSSPINDFFFLPNLHIFEQEFNISSEFHFIYFQM